MPFLEIRGGPKDGYFVEIGGGRCVIGRDMVCDLKLDDGRASRKHCEVVHESSAWKVRDLGSSNGTLLNGRKVKEGDLKDGAEIGVGASVLIFRRSAPTGSQRTSPPVLDVPADARSGATLTAGPDRGAGAGTAPAPGPGTAAARMDTLVADRSALIRAGGAVPADRALEDLRCLFDIGRACAAARTPEAVLQALGSRLGARLACDRLYVFLGAGEGSAAWSAGEAGFADAGKVPVSRTVIDRAVEDNLAVLMTDPSADAEFAAARSIEVNRIVTALAAPLSSGGRPVGVLYADRVGRGEPFAAADLELAAAAGLLAAGSLSGAEELARARAALGDGRMLGESPAMARVRELVTRAAPADAPVLVTGESGTGKELVARAIHAGSKRADRPFEVVNCAALAENLIESELFGHVRGAFTGASSERVGRFEMADGGTLFLDEIGDLSAGAQAKLLRALEQGELSRVGESRVRKVDVRLIAATNRDLEKDVAEKRFRQDLYYRLNVLRIALPPLRERLGDAELLLDRFLADAAVRLGRPVPALEDEVRAKLLAYPWPGNVREMRNLVERLAILSSGGPVGPAELPAEIAGGRGQAAARAATAAGTPVGGPAKLDDLMKEHILAVLASVGNNKSKAAEVLGIDRSTLYARLKEYEGAPGGASAGA